MKSAMPYLLMAVTLLVVAFSWTRGIDNNKDLSADELERMRDSF